MSAPPVRGPLTTFLFKLLVTAMADLGGDPVPLAGDGRAPDAGGWAHGQPGRGKFVPYAVLFPMTAQRQPRQSTGDPHASWTMTYLVRGHGEVREQADRITDAAIAAFTGLGATTHTSNSDFPDIGFGIQQVEVPMIGGTERDDKADPAYWTRGDQLNVWLARAGRA